MQRLIKLNLFGTDIGITEELCPHQSEPAITEKNFLLVFISFNSSRRVFIGLLRRFQPLTVAIEPAAAGIPSYPFKLHFLQLYLFRLTCACCQLTPAKLFIAYCTYRFVISALGVSTSPLRFKTRPAHK